LRYSATIDKTLFLAIKQTIWNKKLIMAHYSENHTGFVVEFDIAV
jgi:hypothetical protein